jgi:hypothetical protein
MMPFISSSVEEMVKPGSDTDIDVELEILERKIMNMEDDDKEMPELIRKRHNLRRKARIEKLTKELGELHKKDSPSESEDDKDSGDKEKDDA